MNESSDSTKRLRKITCKNESASIKKSIKILPKTFQGTPQWINTQQDLEKTLKRLSKEDIVAYDTEFIGEETFFSQLCLVQLATKNEIALIDPLENMDLSPLWELIADNSICKVVHAGNQDLEFPVRLGNKKPKNIFDTQIAAAIAGLPYPLGLSKLLPIFSNITLSGTQTLTDWTIRPLTKSQIEYAANDVRFLPYLHMSLKKLIESQNRLSWLKEELKPLENLNNYSPSIEGHVRRLLKGREASEMTTTILHRLVAMRFATAETEDRPPRNLLPDSVLLAISKAQPTDIDEIKKIQGLPKKFQTQYVKKILSCFNDIQKLSAKAPKPLPPHKRIIQKSEEDAYWSLFCAFCFNRNIDPSFASSRQNFKSWINSSNDDCDSPLASNWRKEAIAIPFKKLLNGEDVLKWKQSVKVPIHGERTPPFNESFAGR